jgi:hypothetical protein
MCLNCRTETVDFISTCENKCELCLGCVMEDFTKKIVKGDVFHLPVFCFSCGKLAAPFDKSLLAFNGPVFSLAHLGVTQVDTESAFVKKFEIALPFIMRFRVFHVLLTCFLHESPELKYPVRICKDELDYPIVNAVRHFCGVDNLTRDTAFLMQLRCRYKDLDPPMELANLEGIIAKILYAQGHLPHINRWYNTKFDQHTKALINTPIQPLDGLSASSLPDHRPGVNLKDVDRYIDEVNTFLS